MTNIYYMTTIGAGMFALLELVIIFIIFAKFPSLIALLTSKNVVWEIEGTGNMEAKKAKAIGGSLKTKRGIYFYERPDVVSFHGVRGVLANMSTDAKAIRPEIQPVLSLMKKLRVDNRERLDALLTAPLITKEQYKELLAAQAQGAA